MTTPPVPNTPGLAKFAVAGVGLAAGLGAAHLLEKTLVGPERAEQLRDEGISVMDSRQAEVYAMAAPFGAAAGIALGIQRRNPTAGLTTSAQIAAAALLSTMAGAVINAETPKAGEYVAGIGLMSAFTGAGILMGVRDEVPMGVARLGGLGLFGFALGVAAPTVVREIGQQAGNLRRGITHDEE